MQMVKRIIGGFFLSLILLWLFAPKQELYYLLEKQLKEQDIIISNEEVKDTWIGLKITHADIYVKGINVAKVAELKLNIFFLYNTLVVNDIKIDSSLHNVAPKVINNIQATYSVMDPSHVQIKGIGSFGTLDGYFTILTQHTKILFPVAKDIRTFKKFLKKDEKGVWKYEAFNKK
jgi:hypothetical protein